MYSILVALLIAAASSLANAQCDTDGTFGAATTLNAAVEFTVQFSTQNTTDFSVKVRAKTTGFMGFGFSESGHMMGSDIVTMAVVQGVPRVEDRFAEWAPFDPSSSFVTPSKPVVDSCQSWTTKCSFEGGGYTEFILSRPYNTSDGQDRVVDPDAYLNIIFAWSVGDDVVYHGTNRGTTILSMNSGPPPAFSPPADATASTDLQMSDYTNDGTRTRYVLKAFDLGATDRHIVAIEALIPDADKPYAHHMLLHACGNNAMYYDNFNLAGVLYPESGLTCTAKTCYSAGFSPLGVPGLCTDMIFGWAKGGGAVTFPADAGFMIGASTTRYVILELHLDNAAGTSGLAITSGMRIHTTTTPRTYEIGTIVLGNPLANMAALPGTLPRVHREGTCPSSCTNGFAGPIKLFRSFLHMHSLGKEIWTTKYNTSGSELVSHKQFWNFAFQNQLELDVNVNPGDSLSTHCVYDTSLSSSSVNFGTQSSQEMCMDFIAYYPKANFGGLTCGTDGGTTTICKTTNSEPNPIPDGATEIPAFVSIGAACDAALQDGGGDGGGGGGGGGGGAAMPNARLSAFLAILSVVFSSLFVVF